jgi:hypothetical protein
MFRLGVLRRGNILFLDFYNSSNDAAPDQSAVVATTSANLQRYSIAVSRYFHGHYFAAANHHRNANGRYGNDVVVCR